MEIVYLTCTPHFVHKEFAKSLDARRVKVPFADLAYLANRYKILRYFYPLIAIVSSFFLRIRGNVILMEGAATFFYLPLLKVRYPELKVIYLDGDITLQVLSKRKNPVVSLFFIKHINGIISLSERNRDFASNLLRIPILTAYPFPNELRKVDIERKNQALYLGRLSAEKNIKRIIEFSENSPFIQKLIICGYGPLKSYVQKKADHNPKFGFRGDIRDVAPQYLQSKFLLHFAKADTFPCTLLEAALCGCYPIISDTIGNSYFFADEFRIADIDDDDMINAKLKWILENEVEARHLLEQSIRKIKTREEAIKHFQEQFHKLLAMLMS